MKKLYHLLFILLLCTGGAMAQDLVGRITEQDSAHSPLFMAQVEQMQEGHILATYKTYFDGTYRIKVKPNQTYELKVSFPGRSDTTVTISVDKHATLYTGTLFISLRKDGLRLTGFILDQVQDIPIKDACIILRNVMTRKDDRFITDINGSYNLKMDYETNYTLKIDKLSPGIINKYQDTSFNISTIGFNKPLDFRLDIKLGPTNGFIAARPEYDPRAKPVNHNLKPAIAIYGIKDSVKKREQEAVIAALNQKLSTKDSVIASLDKRISDMNKARVETRVALKDMDAEEKKKDDDMVRMNLEADSIKQQLAEDQKRQDREKAEADLKTKQQAEKDLQAKLDKEIKDAAERQRQQQAQAAAKQQKDVIDKRAQAQQDSLLKIALAKNKEMMARRKHVKDSLTAIENRDLQVKNEQAKNDIKAVDNSVNVQAPQTKANPTEEYVLTDQDSLLKVAEIKNRALMAKHKHVLDSLINIESQRVQVKTDIRTVDDTRIRDSNRIQAALDAENRKKLMAEKNQAEQDSLLKIAMSKNKDIMARRKQLSDSLAAIASQKQQAINAAKKRAKEKQEYELAQNLAKEKAEQEAAEKQRIENDKKEAELVQQRHLKEQQDSVAAAVAEQEAAIRKAKLEKDLADVKKSREEAQAKILADMREKDAAEKLAAKENKRIAKEQEAKNLKMAQEEAKRKTDTQAKLLASRKADSDKEQRELEAKKALIEQEKSQLTQQLSSLQKDEQSSVTKDQETSKEEYNPDQALKNEKAKTISTYQAQVIQESKRRSDSAANTGRPMPSSHSGAKLIKAIGYVKNGQTEDAISNVSINIRRLNSIVSQEVTSDEAGRYDILVDSGYFYLVSFYKDKYEISKQILDLTTYQKADYTMVIQYLKEKDDFDPNAKMPMVKYNKNSSKLPSDAWGDMQTIIKMMKEIPALRVKIYGLASLDEDYPMELSVTRARLFADMLLESGIKPARMRINGIGAYRPRSGCTEGKTCTEEQYMMDRVVMYKVVKE